MPSVSESQQLSVVRKPPLPSADGKDSWAVEARFYRLLPFHPG